MTDLVANKLAQLLYGLDFIELIGGMTMVLTSEDLLETVDNSAPKTITTKIPISTDYLDRRQDAVCNSSVYRDFVPNSKAACMVYFEDVSGARAIKQHVGYTRFTATLRLVAWYNTNLLTVAAVEAGTRLSMAIISRLGLVVPSLGGPVSDVSIISRTIVRRDASIFGQYTYKEPVTQYLMHPYGYFAILLEVEFSASDKCSSSPIQIKEATC